MRHSALFIALCLGPSFAIASTVLGSPGSTIVLIDDAQVFVDRIVATECGTTTTDTFQIGETLGQWDTESFTMELDDDYCDMVVHLKWTPTSSLVPVSVSGFDTLSITNASQPVEIELDAAAATATLVQ